MLLNASSMRKRDHKELERYVRHIANEMGLRDWDTLIRDMVPILATLARKPANARQALYDAFLNGIERQMEYGIDAVAEAIAPRPTSDRVAVSRSPLDDLSTAS
jgi:hypothetical protein